MDSKPVRTKHAEFYTKINLRNSAFSLFLLQELVKFFYIRYPRKYTGASLRPSPPTEHLPVAERLVLHT